MIFKNKLSVLTQFAQTAETRKIRDNIELALRPKKKKGEKDVRKNFW